MVGNIDSNKPEGVGQWVTRIVTEIMNIFGGGRRTKSFDPLHRSFEFAISSTKVDSHHGQIRAVMEVTCRRHQRSPRFSVARKLPCRGVGGAR